jgi:hypothetical protein
MFIRIIRLGCSILLSLSLVGCLVGPTGYGEQNLGSSDRHIDYIYKLYPGKERQTDEIVILDISEIGSVKINNLQASRFDYQKIHVLPGLHKIDFSHSFLFSVLVEPEMFKTVKKDFQVQLYAGHTYKLKADRTTGQGYEFFFWIEDVNTGKVIAGNKKP